MFKTKRHIARKLILAALWFSGHFHILCSDGHAQISIIPKVGIMTDFISTDQDYGIIGLDTEVLYIVPVYGLSLRYDLESRAYMTLGGRYSHSKRKAFVINADIWDPIQRMSFNNWTLSYTAGYTFKNVLFIDSGLGLTIVDTRKLRQHYAGWLEANEFSNTNIVGIIINGGYEYKKWMVGLSGFLPLKAYSSNSLIKSRNFIHLTIGRRISFKKADVKRRR